MLDRAGLTHMRNASVIKMVGSGLEKKIAKSPWEMIKERRRDVSTMGPRMKPRMKGAT
jgi:hypothetical protein